MARVLARSLVALLVASFAAGCSAPVLSPAESGVPTRTAQPEPENRLDRQAHDALERWAEAVRANGGASITFEGELTSQIGTWEEDVAGNNGPALEAGLVETVTDVPAEPPGRREVKWVDGTKVEVEVFSAREALDELTGSAGGICVACDPLRVTAANLATTLVETSTGPAEVPTWVYSVRGSGVRITRVAVDRGVSVDPPPWDAEDPPEGLSIVAATGESASRDLIVTFLGAEEGCIAEYDVEAVESELAVVVIVSGEPEPNVDESCDEQLGTLRSQSITLSARLRDRVVLEVRQGLPVPVHAP